MPATGRLFLTPAGQTAPFNSGTHVRFYRIHGKDVRRTNREGSLPLFFFLTSA